MFDVIKKKIKAIQKIDRIRLMKMLFKNAEFKQLIINLNTWDQLYDRGEDSTGKTLGEYSPYTKMIKEEKGERYDHITLSDTFDFYKSFKLTQENNGDIKINANTKKDDVDLIVEWGKDIIGLSEESLGILRERSLQLCSTIIKKIVSTTSIAA